MLDCIINILKSVRKILHNTFYFNALSILLNKFVVGIYFMRFDKKAMISVNIFVTLPDLNAQINAEPSLRNGFL